jgi:hypothetical protein
MEKVQHAKSHSMAFCLDCHRNPEKHVRPIEHVFNLGWHPEGESKKEQKKAQLALGTKLVEDWKIQPPESCFGCHR